MNCSSRDDDSAPRVTVRGQQLAQPFARVRLALERVGQDWSLRARRLAPDLSRICSTDAAASLYRFGPHRLVRAHRRSRRLRTSTTCRGRWWFMADGAERVLRERAGSAAQDRRVILASARRADAAIRRVLFKRPAALDGRKIACP